MRDLRRDRRRRAQTLAQPSIQPRYRHIGGKTDTLSQYRASGATRLHCRSFFIYGRKCIVVPSREKQCEPTKIPGIDCGGILILAEDITHRKQMEDALSEISRKLIQSQEHSRESRARKALRDGNRARKFSLSADLFLWRKIRISLMSIRSTRTLRSETPPQTRKKVAACLLYGSEPTAANSEN